MDRFSRTERLLGKEKMKQLAKGRVTVIGLGAVGSYATEALARAGVGFFRLVDFDTIKPSNINRQLYALESTLGEAKVVVAAGRLWDINPRARIEPMKVFAADDTIEAILADDPGIVIDAIDSVNPKVTVLAAAYERRIPVISSMGAALRRDPAAVKVGDLFTTRGCPLALRMRKRLRKRGITSSIPCVYSDERVPAGRGVINDPADEGAEYVRGRRRNVIGSLPTIPGIFGLTIAQWVIEQL